MYGLGGPNLRLGWAIHQFHGVVLALGYVAAVQWAPVTAAARTLRGALGSAVAVVGGGTTAPLSVHLMPLWLAAVGCPYAPSFPDVTTPEKLWSVLGHAVYALPVPVGYALAASK